MSDVKPALTADEWSEHLDRGCLNHDPAGYVDFERGIIDVNIFLGEPRSTPSLAARLLYGQPFGFTWADVDRCLDMASEDEVIAAHQGHVSHFQSPWRDLADRIAALLPPRES